MKGARVLAVVIAAIAAIAPALVAFDSGDVRVDTPPQVVASLPLSAYRPHLDDRTIEQETWDYVFWFPTGHRLLAQFQITDAGPGSRTGLVAAMIVFPDKTTRLIKNSRPRDEWNFDVRGSDVHVSLARHAFDIGAARHSLHIESRLERFEVEAESILPAVVLGTVRYAARDRYELTVLAPRVRATATVQIEGQAPFALSGGGGIALHSSSTLADYEQALNVLRLHTFDRPVESSLLSFSAPGGQTGVSPAWLLTMADGQPIEIAQSVRREFGDVVTEREDPGYTSPRRVRITGTEAGASDVAASLSLVGRFDILGWMNSPLTRFVARRYFHPVQYLFDAPYELHAGRGSGHAAAGKGFGLLWILNRSEWTKMSDAGGAPTSLLIRV